MEIKQGYKQTEVGIVPQDWGLIKLENNFTLKARIGWQGLTTKEYLASGNYSLVTGTDFHDGYINWESCVFVERIRFDQDKNIQLKVGDVLVTKDGTIGKVAYVDRLPNPTTLNSGVFVLRPKNNVVNNRFFYNILMSFYFDEFLNKITAGSTITHLYQKDFIHFNFILPPLPEQTAIANALSDMDALIAQTEKLIEKKKAIKQGAMQELLKPKEGWVTVKIREIAKVGRGRVISQTEIAKSVNKSYPVYSSQTSNNGIMGYIDTYDFEGEYITWTTDGEKAGTVFHRKGKFNCTNVCGTIKLKVGNPRFIHYVLANEAPKYVSRNLANPKLMNEPMKNIEITIPNNIEEQISISNTIHDLATELNFLKIKLQKLKLQKQGMMQALLTGKIRLVS